MIIIINDNLTTGKICVRTEEDLVWTAFCRGMEVCQFIHQRHYQRQLIHAVRDSGCEEVMIVHASRKGIWWWIVSLSLPHVQHDVVFCLLDKSVTFYSLVFFLSQSSLLLYNKNWTYQSQEFRMWEIHPSLARVGIITANAKLKNPRLLAGRPICHFNF